jgi:hypothetical protein
MTTASTWSSLPSRYSKSGRIGEQHAAVDDEQPAAVLEDRHVPADLTEAAERDNAQAAPAKRGGAGEVRMRVAHALVPGR